MPGNEIEPNRRNLEKRCSRQTRLAPSHAPPVFDAFLCSILRTPQRLPIGRFPGTAHVWYRYHSGKNAVLIGKESRGGTCVQMVHSWPAGLTWMATDDSNSNKVEPLIHPTPYTIHPTTYTLHPKPSHPTPYTPNPTPFTLHPTTYTLHPTPCTLRPTPYILNPTPHTLKPETRNPKSKTQPPKPTHHSSLDIPFPVTNLTRWTTDLS